MRAQYHLLEAMGIPLWYPRHNQALIFDSNGPLYCASCLVILTSKPLPGSPSDIILKGMLGVLKLSDKQLCIASLKPDSENAMVREELIRLAPMTILLMGHALRKNFQDLLGLEVFIQETYDPSELLEKPFDKAEAYKNLLSLKEALSALG